MAAPEGTSPAFLQCICLLPLGGRFGRRNPGQRPGAGAACLVGNGIGRMLRGQAVTPGFCSTARNGDRKGCSKAAVRGFAEGFSAGPGGEAIPEVGRSAGLLRVLGESGRTIGVCISATTATRIGKNFRTQRARRCNWRISGRMFRGTWRREESIFRWIEPRLTE